MTKQKLANVASVGQIIIISLLVIHLLPVWIFTYFPTQDGASHIYNSYVLKEYHKHENYRLREVYELRLTLFPKLDFPCVYGTANVCLPAHYLREDSD